MKIPVETSFEDKYDTIKEMYGEILSEFELSKGDNNEAYIVLNTPEDIQSLDKKLEKFIYDYDGSDWRIDKYFGLMFTTTRYDIFTLTIKDQYD